jgi:hypothetical protein
MSNSDPLGLNWFKINGRWDWFRGHGDGVGLTQAQYQKFVIDPAVRAYVCADDACPTSESEALEYYMNVASCSLFESVSECQDQQTFGGGIGAVVHYASKIKFPVHTLESIVTAVDVASSFACIIATSGACAVLVASVTFLADTGANLIEHGGLHGGFWLQEAEIGGETVLTYAAGAQYDKLIGEGWSLYQKAVPRIVAGATGASWSYLTDSAR